MSKNSKSKINAEKVQCYEFYVDGMHCAACELTIERSLKKFKGIKSVNANLDRGIVEIEGIFDENKDELAEDLSELVEKEGYEIFPEKSQVRRKSNWKDFFIAIPLAFVIMIGYFLLQTSGYLVPDFNELNYLTFFLIGVIASLSSCAAVVGGLMLSISANYSKESRGNKILPQISFHISRLISFFVLGGALGLLGTIFAVNSIVGGLLGFIIAAYCFVKLTDKGNFNSFAATILSILLGLAVLAGSSFALEIISSLVNIDINVISRFALTIIVVIIMIIMGLNLLELFSFTKNLGIKIPKKFSHSILRAENIDNWFGPILLGLVTFFLPCGITQSVQVYALGTGNALESALIMVFFALGTLPVLGFISFASINYSENIRSSGVFFKTAGLLVLGFAIYNLLGSFATLGILF